MSIFVRGVGLFVLLPTVAVAQRDSAGVRLYEYTAAALDFKAYADALTPRFTFIGTAKDTSDVVGPTAVVRRPGNQILVAVAYSIQQAPPTGRGASTAGPQIVELRLYDSTGAVIERQGGRVAAPMAAFAAPLAYIGTVGDSTLMRSGLMNFLIPSTNRGFRRFPSDFGARAIAGRFADGSFLAFAPRTARSTSASSAPEATAYIDSLIFYRYSPDFRQTNVLPVIIERPAAMGPARISIDASPPGTTTVTLPNGRRGRGTVTTVRAVLQPAAGWPVVPAPTAGVVGDRFWIVDPTTWELRIHDAAGALRSVFKLPVPPRNVGFARGKTLPADSAYTLTAFADDERRIWVQSSLTAPPWERSVAPGRWWLFSSNGAFLGSVGLPSRFQAFHAGRDFVAGVMQEPSGATSVALFTLRPPS